jgi:cytochrome c peroxidase
MVKQLGWRVPVLLTLIMCGVAIVFWYAPPKSVRAENGSEPRIESGAGAEPITPIPLETKLDAGKVALGRRLFNDTRFSRDNTISCAHCHNLSKGGADGLPHPVGIGGKVGKINTLTVFNSGFNFRLFWDGRAATLEDQMEDPIRNPAEMGSSLPEVTEKLKLDESYRRDFAALYHEDISPQNIKDAVATFERSLTTPNSKFDQYLRGDKTALDNDALEGYRLFKRLGCISCHQGMNVGGNMYEKLGLVSNYFKARGNVQEVDYGRYNITKNEEDRYEFRVPSLRNVALTAPYFHDGSARTLEQAVAAMAKYQLGLTLPREDIAKIVKFLRTLTGVYRGGEDK